MISIIKKLMIDRLDRRERNKEKKHVGSINYERTPPFSCLIFHKLREDDWGDGLSCFAQ